MQAQNRKNNIFGWEDPFGSPMAFIISVISVAEYSVRAVNVLYGRPIAPPNPFSCMNYGACENKTPC